MVAKVFTFNAQKTFLLYFAPIRQKHDRNTSRSGVTVSVINITKIEICIVEKLRNKII